MLFSKSPHVRLEQPLYVLTATNNQDDQLLMTKTLRGSLPTVQLNYCITAEHIQKCLLDQAIEYYCFPRLLLLDSQIADGQLIWQLIQQIRLTYPTLPIVMISSDHRLATIQLAYSLGVNAFVQKSADWNEWRKQLVGLADYWLKVATLPEQSLY